MLLGHSKLGQPEFSAPIPGQCPVDTILNLTSSPLTEILQDHHQLLRGGCVVMGSQVVEPEVRFLLLLEETILSLSIDISIDIWKTKLDLQPSG